MAEAVPKCVTLRRRVWLHDNAGDEESVEEAGRLLEACGVLEVCV